VNETTSPIEHILSDPLFERVDKTGDCWIWTGAKTPEGYGMMRRGHGTRYAHRIVVEMVYGPIPDGMYACHHCDNPPCVRPDHLFIGTPQDNVRDMHAKGRGTWPIRFGSENSFAVLTESVVMEMRRLSSEGVATAEIARRFNQNEGTTAHAIAGTTWGHLPGAVPLTPRAKHRRWIRSQAPMMRDRAANGESLRDIAKSLGISIGAVSRAIAADSTQGAL
jgi:hypothetical protein